MDRASLTLAFPCTADFSRMREVPGGRHCDDCDKVVHDLSSMSEADAREVLRSQPPDRVCVRYVYEPDGRVVFGGVPRGVAIVPEHALSRKWKHTLALAAAAAATSAVAMLIEACGGANPDDGYGYYGAEQDAGADGDAQADAAAKPDGQ